MSTGKQTDRETVMYNPNTTEDQQVTGAPFCGLWHTSKQLK